jgi:hypothetical protein
MTLADANVQLNDTLYLNPKQFNMDVRGPDGKTFQMKMAPADSINTLRKKLGKVQGIPPEEQRFVYESMALGSDPRNTLDLTHGTSVAVRTPDGRSLKKMEGMIGLPVGNQRALFEERELYDDKRLRDYDTPQGGTLVITDPNNKASPLSSVTAKLATVEIDPEDSVASIRNKMQYRQDIPEDQRGVPLEDRITLGDYGVPFDSMLDFEVLIMVYVQFPESYPGVTKAKDVSESESRGIAPSSTSAGVVANVPRRDGSVGLINKAEGRGFIEYNTVNFVHSISAFGVLLGISFLIIGYAMGANSILIGLTLTAKCKRMLATNREGVETIGCTSCTCSEMSTLAQNNFMNGTGTSACTNALLCVLLFSYHVCKQ